MRGGRWAAAVLVLAAGTGCATTGGSVGLLGQDPEVAGVKMLVPHAVGRSCRASVFGIPLTAGEPSLEEAFLALVDADDTGAAGS